MTFLRSYVGGAWVAGGSLTIGTLLAFWQLLDQFFSPIEDLSDKYSTLQAAMASSERIFRIFDTQPQITDPVQPVARPCDGAVHAVLEVEYIPHPQPGRPERRDLRRESGL